MPANQRKQAQQPNLDDAELAPQERITQQLVRQLKPHLPIRSVETITEKMDELEVEHHRLPLRLFVPFIGKDLFPVKTVEDLEQKLSQGVRRAVALAKSGFIPVGNPLVIEILSTTFQEPEKYLGARGPVRPMYTYDPTPTPGPTTGTSLQEDGGK